MIIDARQVPAASVLRGDVCLVGGGPIGITIARRLEAAGLDVVMLESGGLDDDPAADALGAPAEISFGDIRTLWNTRRLGGNAHAWHVRTGLSWRGVRLIPLQPVDLDGRPGRPETAWPVSSQTLDRYLVRAQDALGLPAAPFEPDRWSTGLEDQVLRDPDLRAAIFQFGDGGAVVGDGVAALAASARVRVYHHASAVEVLTGDSGTLATGVRVVTAPGRELTVLAPQVVLAAGCISTTQLMLASDRVHRDGLGNAHGHLGRWFMDHPILDGGRLRPASRADFDHRELYDLRVVDGRPVMGHLQLSPDALSREQIPGLSALLFPRESNHDRHKALSPRQKAGVAGGIAVRESMLRHQRPRPDALRAAVAGLDGLVKRAVTGRIYPVSSLGRGGWASRGNKQRVFDHFDVVNQVEQPPRGDNRITLSAERDVTGLRKVRIDWRWHDEDVEATMRGQDLMADALRRAGWGEYVPARVDGRPVVTSWSANHFMGTTRMSARPADGVVDADCAVHGVPNLLVASSSVFPSGGYANVTLTTAALALRVADLVVDRARLAASSTTGGGTATPHDAAHRPLEAAGSSRSVLALAAAAASLFVPDATVLEEARPATTGDQTVATDVPLGPPPPDL